MLFAEEMQHGLIQAGIALPAAAGLGYMLAAHTREEPTVHAAHRS